MLRHADARPDRRRTRGADEAAAGADRPRQVPVVAAVMNARLHDGAEQGCSGEAATASAEAAPAGARQANRAFAGERAEAQTVKYQSKDRI